MQKPSHVVCACLFIFMAGTANCQPPQSDWIDLFNGKDLSGWKANENPGSFRVEEGVLIAEGERSHLFYMGEGDTPPVFKNFELEMQIMTHKFANSGVYIHTQYQKEGWPEKGNEIQVNNTHIGGGDYRELKKGGSLYLTRNSYKAMARDSVWYHMRVRVAGKQVQVWIDGIQTVNYIEPKNPLAAGITENHLLTSGTFAIQGHDPGSKVTFKNIRLKILPEDAGADIQPPLYGEWEQKILTYQQRHFAFVDLNVALDSVSELPGIVADVYHTGANAGIVLGRELDELGAEAWDRWLTALKKYPIFRGLKLEEPSQAEGLSLENLIQYDYFIAAINPDLEVNPNQPQAYMEAHMSWVLDELDLGGVDIWSNADALPTAFSDQYDRLWTTERMAQVLEMARKSRMAIEINNATRSPSLPFLKIAKEKGCKFTMTGMRTAEAAQGSEYIFDVIDSLNLDYKDFFIPRSTYPAE